MFCSYGQTDGHYVTMYSVLIGNIQDGHLQKTLFNFRPNSKIYKTFSITRHLVQANIYIASLRDLYRLRGVSRLLPGDWYRDMRVSFVIWLYYSSLNFSIMIYSYTQACMFLLIHHKLDKHWRDKCIFCFGYFLQSYL